ncbi:hypothetical protein OKW50_005917 [Paraburkholderia youngii]
MNSRPLIEFSSGAVENHHRDESARHDLFGVVEAQEIQAEQREALRGEVAPGAERRPDRPAHDAQQREQQQRGDPETPCNRYRRRHRAELPFDRDPRGAPDQHGDGIKQKIHGRASDCMTGCHNAQH